MITKEKIKEHMQKNAEENGYYLCPDPQLLDTLLQGLMKNEQRYGYGSCPCRIASGKKIYDADIICPCEYRDADVDEFGMCYCGLFVNQTIKENPTQLIPIPERRPVEVQNVAMAVSAQPPGHDKQQSQQKQHTKKTLIPVWRCTVCGYLCARETPPPICPICKAKAERFEPFFL